MTIIVSAYGDMSNIRLFPLLTIGWLLASTELYINSKSMLYIYDTMH